MLLFSQVPWEALQYITGSIHYGGRVTDEWDRRCLSFVLNSVVCEEALADDFCYGCEPYFAPREGAREEYASYASRLPLEEQAGVFGMHESAQV